ncbi:hypothetical protein CHUAL_009062 [Chamberlinius hualienensis]
MLFGGRGINENSTNVILMSDLWSYNSTANKWNHLIGQRANSQGKNSEPPGREMSAMCGSKNSDRLIVFGGRIEQNDSCVATNELLIFYLKHKITWKNYKSSKAPSPRFDSLYWCDEENDQMHVVGGKGQEGQLLEDSWKLHLSNLTWVQQHPTLRVNRTGLQAVDNSALLWILPKGDAFLMREKIEQINNNISDFNVQLWKLIVKNRSNNPVNWTLINESNQGIVTWPGVHRHGGTCTDLDGNLWLFNGESEIDGQLYLNNDLWFYNISSNLWYKVELMSSSHLPVQRHMSIAWCQNNILYNYGGSSCSDATCFNSGTTNAECLLGDLWQLNITVNTYMEASSSIDDVPASQKTTEIAAKSTVITKSIDDLPPVLKISKPKQEIPIHSNEIPTLPSTTTTTPKPLIKSSTTASNNGTVIGISVTTAPYHNINNVPDSAVLNRILNEPNNGLAENDQSPPMADVDQEESPNHGVYGSAIFFGISITMFALFGMVIFFRRCVSCPPRENLLLKESPPVRYTVIPDDSYSI